MTDLMTHLQSGCTTVARCWRVTRADGVTYGFTDHDVDIEFENMTFRADAGLSARALAQTTGLSVDNSEAVGILQDASLSEAEIEQGRFDGAEVVSWLVNWAQVDQRVVQFRGTLGDIRRSGGAFYAELRGLTDALNQPRGRVFQRQCAAVLGDTECGVTLDAAPYGFEASVDDVTGGKSFRFGAFDGVDPEWFARGTLRVLTGEAAGLMGVIKLDQQSATYRQIELWEPLRAEVTSGDVIRLQAGCDKSTGMCQFKFANFLNYRGFPHIPGEDWLVSVPRGAGADDGGSLLT